MLFADSAAVRAFSFYLALASVLGLSALLWPGKEAGAASRPQIGLTLQERLDRILPAPVDRFEPYLPEGWEPLDVEGRADCIFGARAVRNGQEYALLVRARPKTDDHVEKLAALGGAENLAQYEKEISEVAGTPFTIGRVVLVGRPGLIMDTYHDNWSRCAFSIFCKDTEYVFSFWFQGETDWSDIWTDMLRIVYISRFPEEEPGIGAVLPMGWVIQPNLSEPNEDVMDVLNAYLLVDQEIVSCMVSLQSAQYAFNDRTLRRMSPESVERQCARMRSRYSSESHTPVRCGREEYFGLAAITHEFAAKNKEKNDIREYNFYPDSGPFTVSFYGRSLEKYEKDIMDIVENTVSLLTE